MIVGALDVGQGSFMDELSEVAEPDHIFNLFLQMIAFLGVVIMILMELAIFILVMAA